jgi:hydrogenase expression/formation protein HypE
LPPALRPSNIDLHQTDIVFILVARSGHPPDTRLARIEMMDTTDLNLDGWTCPLPLRDYPTIVMGHGSGGKLMADLIEHLFAPQFANDLLDQMGDATTLKFEISNLKFQMAFTTDSFVVRPLFFPGGNIGELAVNGTVNDLAMRGARPLYLSAGFILEEGLPMETLGRIATSMGQACQAAGVQLVTGDTKVVGKGQGDGVYINTSGIGLIAEGVDIGPTRAQPGDVVIVSGTIGDHGVAVMSVREGLEFETALESDTAPLWGLVEAMLAADTSAVHVLRDPTRGGLGVTLNEIARASHVGIELDERAIPVKPAVRSACEMLGLDPLYVANEGKLIAIAAPDKADALLAAMHAQVHGHEATVIGQVVTGHRGLVTARTGIGGTRVVDVPAGELLPRIC